MVTGIGIIQHAGIGKESFFRIPWFLFITHTKVTISLVSQTVNSPGVEFQVN